MRPVPVVEFDPVCAGRWAARRTALYTIPAHRGGADLDGVVGVLWRIDAVTAAAVNAGLSSARCSSRVGSARGGRDHEGGARVAAGGAGGLPVGAGDGGGASGAAGDRLVGRAGRRLAARLDRAGEYDLALGPLITALHAPAVAAGLPTRAPAEQGKRGMCGIARRGSPPPTGSCPMGSGRGSRGSCWTAPGSRCRGCGWAAVGGGTPRGGPHPHRRGVGAPGHARRFWPHHDYPKLRAAARRIEQRLGLTVTAAPDGTAAPRPSRGEMEKAGREGRVPARVELRRAAQQAAVAATDVDGFVAYLQEHGYRVGLRRAPSGICWATSSPGPGM